MASYLGVALIPSRFPGPLPRVLDRDGTRGTHTPQPPSSHPSHFFSPRLPPERWINLGALSFLPHPALRTETPHRQTRYRSLSAGAGANPIYRPGQTRPARMRLRLTPLASALPSPARPHPPHRSSHQTCLGPRRPTPGAAGRAHPGPQSAVTCARLHLSA